MPVRTVTSALAEVLEVLPWVRLLMALVEMPPRVSVLPAVMSTTALELPEEPLLLLAAVAVIWPALRLPVPLLSVTAASA